MEKIKSNLILKPLILTIGLFWLLVGCDGTVSGVIGSSTSDQSDASFASYKINNDSLFTNQDEIEIQIDPIGAKYYLIASDVQTCEQGMNWLSISNRVQTTFTVTHPNSSNSLFLRFKDGSDKTSSCKAIEIQHDNQQPLPPNSFDISPVGDGSVIPQFSFSSSSDLGASGISHYEIALYKSTGNIRVSPWIPSNQSASLVAYSSNIAIELHYFAIRSVDNAGNISTIVKSQSQWIAGARVGSVPSEIKDQYKPYIPSETFGNKTLFVLDADNDGDSDKLSLSSNSELLFEKNNMGTYSIEVLESNIDMVENITVADWEGDGDLDIVFFYHPLGSLSYYLGLVEFKPTGCVFHKKISTYVGMYSATMASILLKDINSDGIKEIIYLHRLDILFSANDEIYLNTFSWTGTQFNSTSTLIYISSTTPMLQGIENLDGDLDFEYVISISNKLIYVDISSLPASTTEISTVGLIESNLVIADFDGDTDKDILFTESSGNGSMILLSNDGSGNFSSTTLVDMGAKFLSVQIIDFDKDGDFDVVGILNNKDLVWYRNDGSNIFSTAITIHSSPKKYVDYQIVDLDKDGDNDIIGYSQDVLIYSTLYYQNFHVLKNAAMSFTENIIYSYATLSVNRKLFIGDLDGNSYIDILYDGVQFLNQDNSNFITNFEYYVTTSSVLADSEVDVNNDGVLDLFSVANNVAFIDQSNGTSSVRKIIYQCGTSTQAVSTLDFDKDGDFDAVVLCTDKLVLIENTGGNFSFFKTLNTSTVFFDRIGIYDFDKDGDFDVYGYGYQSGWFKNDGSNNLTYIPLNSSLKPYDQRIVDLNQDGWMDLIGGELNVDLEWYRNNGDGSFTRISIFSGTNLRLFDVTDHDGDGDLDIIFDSSSSSTIGFFARLNDGSQNFSTEVPIAALTNIGHAQPVDYNHDGKMDYILYGEEDMSLLISQPDATYDQLYLSIYYYFWAQYGNLDKLQFQIQNRPSPLPPVLFHIEKDIYLE